MIVFLSTFHSIQNLCVGSTPTWQPNLCRFNLLPDLASASLAPRSRGCFLAWKVCQQHVRYHVKKQFEPENPKHNPPGANVDNLHVRFVFAHTETTSRIKLKLSATSFLESRSTAAPPQHPKLSNPNSARCRAKSDWQHHQQEHVALRRHCSHYDDLLEDFGLDATLEEAQLRRGRSAPLEGFVQGYNGRNQ